MKLPLFFRCTLFASLILCSTSLLAANVADLPLMPWPQKITINEGHLTVDRNIQFQVTGDDLSPMVEQWRQRLEAQTGWLILTSDAANSTVIQITLTNKVDPLPTVNMDESYRLIIDNQGIKLNAHSRFGALRGMETLLQLLKNGGDNAYLPLVDIEDSPRFVWRGVLIDSARHFMPIESIKRQIDGIAAAKMNVLHWHLTDDQGWRFASTAYPKLQQLASDGLYYSQADMRDIVNYASQRGIRVVPEIDLPGHASAIAVAYPELMSAPGPYTMQRDWGVHKPTLDPSNPAVYQFAETIISELSQIFPDQYIHIGGDEVDSTQWQNSAQIQQFMQQEKLADPHALHAYFNQRLEQILNQHQRRMVGWDEIYHPALPRSIVIQSWRGQDSLGDIAQAGYQGILSTGFYLDQPQSTAYHYRNEIQPQPLAVNDQVQKGETIQSWGFTMPRLKGSAVKGTFSLINGSDGWRGFIDFAGKSRRAVNNIQWLNKNMVRFSLDSWMGETTPVVTLQDNSLSGYILIGNVRYPVSGERLATVPKASYPVVPDIKQSQYILGGEAALWSENITGEMLDIKLWPRTFAVAERLWSDKTVQDEQNMYQRLNAIDAWSTVSVGLQQHTMPIKLMMRLANSPQIEPLQILAEAVEPAQYYTRHHAKFQQGNYNQFERLNRFADLLPPESLTVREMEQLVSRLIANQQDYMAADGLRMRLQRWQGNNSSLTTLISQNPAMADLQPVVDDITSISAFGLMLLDHWQGGKSLTAQQISDGQQLLDNASVMRDEMVIRAVYPLERLLQAMNPPQ